MNKDKKEHKNSEKEEKENKNLKKDKQESKNSKKENKNLKKEKQEGNDSKKESKDLKKNKQEQKALKKVKEESETSKVFRTIKRKWLISGTNTFLIIAIMIAIFVLINAIVKNIDPTPIDCTTSQDWTLTEESKNRVKTIEQEVNIYFVGYEDTNQDYLLAKQYNKANSKITVEIVDSSEALTRFKEYDLSTDVPAIVIESGESSRVIDYYDTYTYDSSYNTVSVAEQKITSAILNVTSNKIAKVYYLTGYTEFTFDYGLTYFSQYLDDEVLTYEELNILSTQKVPDDCDTLMIVTPSKDFDKITADAIIDYIQKGGNILWFNGINLEDENFTNVNRVLAEYGVEAFGTGYIYESDSQKYYYNINALFEPEIQYTEVTSNIYDALGTIFLYATKININSDKLEELNVTETDLLLSSDTSYYISDSSRTTVNKDDESGSFVLGTLLEKTISENTAEEDEEDNSVKSKLIIYGNDYFITDMQINQNIYPMIFLQNNADLALNSLSYLNNRDVDITIRKTYSDSTTSFTPTDGEKSTIMKVIFIVPVAIILFGIIVFIRRRKK